MSEQLEEVVEGLPQPMVILDGVSKVFGNGPKAVPAVDNVSLTINRGEIFAIIGYSGAGKSTLVRLINGLEKTTSGTLIVDDFEISGKRDSELREARTNIGMIFQQFNLFSTKTVAQNIAYPLQLDHWRKDYQDRRVNELLEFVGLSEHANKYPSQLSGGQKQRVAIAGVVAMRPDCLILDEATAMLDPRGREQVMQTIHHLNKNMGITVVSITHYMEEAAQADRVLVMSKGHVVMEGTPKEVFSQTEKVRSLHLDVPQAAELRDELVKAGIPMPEGIIDTGECAQALYELLQ